MRTTFVAVAVFFFRTDPTTCGTKDEGLALPDHCDACVVGGQHRRAQNGGADFDKKIQGFPVSGDTP
jgi:hypothetical protein